MKKKILAIAMTAIVAALGLTGCNNGMGINDDGTYTWKMALNSTEGDNAYDTGAAFAKKIEELTDGRVEVVLYGGGSLGTTSEVLEGMKFGVANVMCESIGTLATFTPMANIDATPYLFRDYDHFMETWNSDVGEEIKETVGEESGFKLLGGTYRGPRIVTATKEMKNIEDFKGFKLRAPNLEMYLETWKWMKAAPTPIAMTETYTALQQKTVDGQENPMTDSLNYAFDEVCKYWIKTNHVYSSNVIIMDREYFDALPEDIQQAVREAAEYAGVTVSEQQLQKLVSDNLKRIGGLTEGTDYEMCDILGMEEPFRYRNKAQYPVGEDKDGNIVMGFYAGHTHSIIPCPDDDCLLGHSDNAVILKAVKAWMEKYRVRSYDESIHKGTVRHILIRTGFHTDEIMLCLVTKKMLRKEAADGLVDVVKELNGEISGRG